ncbi:MAG: S-methyl-5-thioribose-1-phosphate isomerase [Candidatus Omnitrophica bacterium]|nr:S-methyl-5-thioribose-1-phosphate isomerase [Candidatus Omnitrophota bacterium]
MKYDTMRWRKDALELLDQRLLPRETRYVKCFTEREVSKAIKNMTVRGAPAIGIAGAYGAYLGIRGIRTKNNIEFDRKLDNVIKYLAGARPTARNLFWALERIKRVAEKNKGKTVDKIKSIMLDEAHAILREDINICREIGRHGAALIKKNSNVLTHCNAGALATGGYGTALGVIFSAKKKIKMVYADETRPVLQGARLTVWELIKNNVPATLICDNMAASLMAKDKIDAIIVGADRIAANGDTANKIGTYSLAVNAKYHKVPFYVAAPFSTFDLAIKNGREIPIEERSPEEVKSVGGQMLTVASVNVVNPAFDVTPAKLITAIITERGVIRRPNTASVRRILSM